ncbi:MAG: alpha-glucosidase [Caulobacteraceae bacterium]|nr:alpha-glucosidase [Caulobacteraceae bacterium]
MGRDDQGAGVSDTDWWRGAVIYQIYPRSFFDSNGDGVGDLRGVTAKLEYVASLGVNGIWLSPFFTSPMKDFGYDVSDYRDVDPLFGTLADFDALLARAHELGLRVVIDQVWSHTSDRHPWFVESASSRENARSDWYVWAHAKPDGTAPNNWMAVFGGPSWTWNARRRQYYLHNFLGSQPDLNFWNPEVEDAVLDVARFWLDRGVDGFRLDVINFIAHDPALTNNPAAPWTRSPTETARFQRHVHDRSQARALGFLTRLRTLMDGYADRMTVGEIVDEASLERQQEYTRPPDRLHTAYSFYLLSAAAAPPALFAQAMESWKSARGWPSWSLGNHDVPRFPSRLAGGDAAHARILLAALFCLRGTIFLYQGEELGLPQANVPFDRLRDPFVIANYTGSSGRDGARTPMPWAEAAPNGGFSSALKTWLPVDPAHLALAVSRQESDPQAMLSHTRRLVDLRKAWPCLRWGEAIVRPAPEGMFALERRDGAQRLLCLFELAGRGASMALRETADIVEVFGDARREGFGIALAPFSGCVLKL